MEVNGGVSITQFSTIAGWWLEFYILAASKVISGQVATRDSAHSWQLYSAVLFDNKAIATMAWCTTQSHYPVIELTSLCPIILNTKLESNKY